MSSLQIKDMPDDLYARYKQCCADKGRSMSQQTLRLIEAHLASKGYLDCSTADANDAPYIETGASHMSDPAATAAPPRAGEAAWRDAIHDPMADVTGREERIAKRKALFKRCDEMKLKEIKLPPGHSSPADLIREDRDNDLGRSWVKEALE